MLLQNKSWPLDQIPIITTLDSNLWRLNGWWIASLSMCDRLKVLGIIWRGFSGIGDWGLGQGMESDGDGCVWLEAGHGVCGVIFYSID